MLKKIKTNLTITTRLIISFTLIIILFIVGVIQSNYTTVQVDKLHRYNLEFVVTRTEYVLDFKQEFMAFRRLARMSVMNLEWRQNADEATMLAYEDRLTTHYERMTELAMNFIQSAAQDYRLESVSQDMRIGLMTDAINKTDVVYGMIVDNFFLSGSQNFDDANVTPLADEVDAMLYMLRLLSYERREATLLQIEQAIASNTRSTVFSIIIFCFLSVAIFFVMLKSFKTNIGDVERQIAMVELGNFKAIPDKAQTDEISKMFAKLMGVFTSLISQINEVADKMKDDNADARINADNFSGSYKETALAINALMDIMSEQKNSLELAKERELEASERARLMFETVPVIVEFWNEDFECINSNPYCCNLFGISSEEYEKNVYDFMPEFQPCGTRSVELWQSHLKQIEFGGHGSYSFVCRMLDDSPLYIDVLAVRTSVNDETVYITYSVNTTDLILSQRETQAAMERARHIFESAPLAISFWDSDVNIVDCNDNFMNVFGAEDKARLLAEFPQKYTPEFQPDGTRGDTIPNYYIPKANEDGFVRFEWMHQDAGGNPLPCEIAIVRLQLHDTHAYAAYARDLREEKKAAAKLSDANARARIIFDNAPLAISFWTLIDGELKIVDCNASFMNMFAVEDKAKLLSEFPQNYTPDFQPDGSPSLETVVGYTQLAIDNGSHKFEWMHFDALGNPLPCEIVSVSAKFHDSHVIIAYARDLREKKRAAMRLDNANTRTRVFFERTPLAITFWDENRMPVDCNNACVSLFGMTDKREYIEDFYRFSSIRQPCGTLTTVRVKEVFDEAFANGVTVFNWMHIDAQGKPVPCEITLAHIELHGSHAYVAYFNDLRDTLESEKKIREANERVKLMLDSNPVACFLINKDFEAIDCNMEAVKLFELSNKAECISSFGEIFNDENGVHDDEEHTLHAQFEKALVHNRAKIEHPLQIPGSDDTIPCEVHFVRLVHKDDFVVAAYIIDMRVLKKMIEDMRRLETAEENSMAKTKFLARMSHEIRTPITAVLGISEIQLQNPRLPLEVEEAFAKICDSAGILMGIIDDILDISKIESGKMELIAQQYEVSSILIDIVQMHLIYLGSKTVKLAINADENMPSNLIGDDLRIKQILNNILTNAIKYTNIGSITLSMYCEPLYESDMLGAETNLVMRVSDTGKGMTKTQIEALRDEYARFHEREDRFTSGVGLGMPIVYNLVELMNGKIEIESEVGAGTTVTVILPQTIATEERLGRETAENLRRFDPKILSGKQKINFTPEPMPYGKVLVVDDVETNLYVAQGLMSFYELNIETVSSGTQAIEKVKSGATYDIIFMDHMMPDMNGIEATRILRHLGYGHPIVAFTANALIGQAEEFMKNGFDGFISKPIQVVHLNAILNKFIRDKQPPEVLEAAAKARASRPKPKATINNYLDRADIAEKLRKDFLRTQKNTMRDINSAIAENDFKAAHLLAHTLKGLAGFIGEGRLADFSRQCEESFKNGKAPEDLLGVLAQEIEAVLKRIENQYHTEPPLGKMPDLDKEKAAKLFDELSELLEQSRGTAIDLLDDLALIPHTEELIDQIADVDFAIALQTLKALRIKLEV